MEKKESRQFHRIPKNTTLKIRSCDQESHEGLLLTLISVNLSKSGILFESTQKYDVGKKYFIRFTGKDNKLYDVLIEVIRVKEVITHTQYNIGAKFIETDSEKIQMLIQ